MLLKVFVKLRQESGKDWQGMAPKAKGLKLKPLPRAYIKVGCHHHPPTTTTTTRTFNFT